MLHTQIGRRWVNVEGRGDLNERAQEIHEKTWKALDQYKSLEAQSAEWWKDFVRQVLNVESAARPADLNPASVDVVSNG